ncbi:MULTISPECIES: DNA primase [Streptococcus]|uniref:DNA primase n=1 Tax=Streptococcus mitis bv. 2 str. F0392 TaxID=768726 RepID=F9P125_STROR|nr:MULTISPECIES: DNA primase [Streptococcus]EGR93645.1 DNA primase [Streptococcus mitis bv. 2 str. F0392]ORO82065.1 DNA primase [Streptococcus oralis subsp. dentisani]RSJ03208.1 DNA primase [Streptococcus mitis]
MVDKQVIEEIKNNANIVEVIGDVISLQKAGRNYLGLCPFHGEKTPSFNVVEDKQFYHCFGCGRSGDVFKFIEEYQGVSFMEAVQLLGERVGIQLAMPVQSRPQQASPHQALYDMHEEAARFYHAILMTTKMGEEARAYLYKRGLTDDVLKHFQIGLAPAERTYLYQRLADKFEEKDLLDSGLFYLSDGNQFYDTFFGRIIFPLTNDKGQVIAFSGRVWQETDTQTAKYKNSRSTAIFNKSYELYHLDRAKKGTGKITELYLMEGFMDVIAAYRAGIENAVASMGTALSKEHVDHLKRFTKKIVLSYDGDKAGQAATAKALEELKDFSVEVVRVPDAMDPDEYLQKNSAEDLAYLLTKTRISPIEFYIHQLKPENSDNLQAQIEFIEKIAPLIAKEKSITAQNSYIHILADNLPSFDYQQVEQIVNESRIVQRQERVKEHPKPATISLPVTRQLTSVMRAEAHLLYRMAENPLVLNDYRLRENFFFDTPEFQILYELLSVEGEIGSEELSHQTPEVENAWYHVLSLDLPAEMSPQELAEVEATRNRALLSKDNLRIKKKVQEASHVGDTDTALEELQRLISQKRRME